ECKCSSPALPRSEVGGDRPGVSTRSVLTSVQAGELGGAFHASGFLSLVRQHGIETNSNAIMCPPTMVGALDSTLQGFIQMPESQVLPPHVYDPRVAVSLHAAYG